MQTPKAHNMSDVLQSKSTAAAASEKQLHTHFSKMMLKQEETENLLGTYFSLDTNNLFTYILSIYYLSVWLSSIHCRHSSVLYPSS